MKSLADRLEDEAYASLLEDSERIVPIVQRGKKDLLKELVELIAKNLYRIVSIGREKPPEINSTGVLSVAGR